MSRDDDARGELIDALIGGHLDRSIETLHPLGQVDPRCAGRVRGA